MPEAATDFEIRTATIDDAAHVRDIYAPYVENTAITFEYHAPTVDEIENRIATTLQTYPYLVAERLGRIIGFTYAGPFRQRPAYNWTAETTIYLTPQAKGSGIGKVLYDELARLLRSQNIMKAVACVAQSNAESIRFHEKAGFTLAGRIANCGFKHGSWHDVVWMEKILGDPAGAPHPVIPFSQLA